MQVFVLQRNWKFCLLTTCLPTDLSTGWYVTEKRYCISSNKRRLSYWNNYIQIDQIVQVQTAMSVMQMEYLHFEIASNKNKVLYLYKGSCPIKSKNGKKFNLEAYNRETI